MNNIGQIIKETGNSDDIIIREIMFKDKTLNIVFNETLSSGNFICEYIMKGIINANVENTTIEELINIIPTNSVNLINNINDALDYLYKGFAIILIEDNYYIAIEAKANLDKGISDATSEVSIIGPKEAFTENLAKNIGLIRKRIRSRNLYVESTILGKESNTKISICYMNNIIDKKLLENVRNKINEINIDNVMDSGFISEVITDKNSLFPTINMTERPDLVTFALLEGKIAIVVDNTPYVLIIPTFFTDLFHTPDDYYQKNVNTTFARILRLITFLASILLPAYYISITTHNSSSIPITLLVNFTSQKMGVPFPAFIEVILMIIAFEILRESDIRIPSKTGTSISILGGLILGDAAVNAGLISPIMIIVTSLSAISAMVFTNNSLINAIRYYRIINILIATFFGIYGIFIGISLLIIKLSNMESFGFPYLAPISPIITEELDDSFIKTKSKIPNKRNPLLAKKNIIRGK